MISKYMTTKLLIDQIDKNTNQVGFLFPHYKVYLYDKAN